jgi:hypothetical protein
MISRVPVNGPLLWSGAFIVIAALTVAATVPAVVVAALRSGGDAEVGEKLANAMKEAEENLNSDLARFRGRSPFVKPKPIRKEAPVIERPALVDSTPPPPPPPPEETKPAVQPPYRGPTIRAIALDEVWFHGDAKLKVGESGGGVKLLSVNAPWSAQVEFDGWEYKVPFLTQDLSGVLASNSSDAAKIEAAAAAIIRGQPDSGASSAAPAPAPAANGGAAPAEGERTPPRAPGRRAARPRSSDE